MIPCLEKSSCTPLMPFWLCKLVQSLVEASNLNFRNAFGPTALRNKVSLVHFLMDFNALFHKNQRCFAICLNFTSDHDRLWILAMFNNCLECTNLILSFLGVMNLLNCKELLIGDKESLPTMTCGPSRKFSASSEPYELVFFSEKLNFSQLVSSKL
ncbi:uncharacterized protein TNCV_3487841 [Trichonephila clavipes]|nr:uncharacterized protein TNCV_3487841 [Trichonephila clavipes]